MNVLVFDSSDRVPSLTFISYLKSKKQSQGQNINIKLY
jgi:hypothetical protein